MTACIKNLLSYAIIEEWSNINFTGHRKYTKPRNENWKRTPVSKLPSSLVAPLAPWAEVQERISVLGQKQQGGKGEGEGERRRNEEGWVQ